MKINISAFALLAVASSLHAQVIPFNDERWSIAAQSSLIENYKGYNSLYLQNGSAELKDADFTNGTIEFDMYLTERVSFSGAAWRIKESTFEHFYIRSQRSDFPDAYQYNPVWNGNSSWQLYHDQYDGDNNGLVGWTPKGEGVGYNGVLHLEFDKWTHVKLVISGEQAEIFFNNQAKPAIFIRKLNQPVAAGGIGLTSSAGPTHFANFKYQINPDQTLISSGNATSKKPEGTILNWQVSSPFDSERLKEIYPDESFLKSLQWSPAEAEITGMLNIGKLFPRRGAVSSVLVKAVIKSEVKAVKQLDFGYSDKITVYFDGKTLYSGDNSYRSRDFRFLGTVGYFDSVYLSLEKGDNTVLFMVSELFGGWGIQAKFGDSKGIRIVDAK